MLKFVRVSKNFFGNQHALTDVSFEVEKGDLVLITGPSGSGKTTLLKLITKEYEPSEGEIYFGDQELHHLKRSQVPFHRRKIGAVFQDYKLLPELNVWENIALALSILGNQDGEIAEKVTDLLKLVGLVDKAYLFPHQLSGGEAQRISIARALSTAPQLIFADEPTGNLDADNSLIIAKLLKKINELGTTVIVTTHDPVVIKYLDEARKMSLDNGILTEEKPRKTEKKAEKAEAVEKIEAEDDEDDEGEKVAVIKDVDSKVKKNWGFFGIFKRKSSGEVMDQQVEETVAVDEEVELDEEDDDLDDESEEIKPAKKDKKHKVKTKKSKDD